MNKRNELTNTHPFVIFKPYNLALLFTFYSPVIISIFIVTLSIVFQNFKGFVYLLWLFLSTILRSFIIEHSGINLGNDNIFINQPNLCKIVQYSKNANNTFSMFFISFSLVYICSPMFMNNQINYLIFTIFLSYFVLDLIVRYYTKCIQNISSVILDTMFGTLCGVSSISIMYSTQTQKLLFFNETSNNNNVCSMPSKQMFKCSVYKNGQLISSTMN